MSPVDKVYHAANVRVKGDMRGEDQCAKISTVVSSRRDGQRNISWMSEAMIEDMWDIVSIKPGVGRRCLGDVELP